MDAGDLDALSALAEPVRRRLYRLAATAGRPFGRDEAARAAGIGRPLAAYHLDRLAAAGLLDVSYARAAGRRGPGAGRPAKLYARARREIALQAPPRDYRLLAELLVRTAAAEPRLQPALERAATALGEELGAAGGTLEQALAERGYEPADEDGVLRLGNCPFEAAAVQCPDVVCAVNLALVRGLLRGLGRDPEDASLAPQPGSCCVAVRAAPVRRHT